jgi:hypothetical protein
MVNIVVKPANNEITLTTANTVYSAKAVRLVNTGAAVSVITVGAVANGTLAGSFSLRANSEVVVQKQPTDTLASSASTVVATPVAWL